MTVVCSCSSQAAVMMQSTILIFFLSHACAIVAAQYAHPLEPRATEAPLDGEIVETAPAAPQDGGVVGIFKASEMSEENGGMAISQLFDSPSWNEPRALFGRQQKCPYPVMCSSTRCCPAGTNCVGTMLPLNSVKAGF
jgi:hypothetical protein